MPTKAGIGKQIEFSQTGIDTASASSSLPATKTVNPIICVPNYLSKTYTGHKTMYSKLSIENRARFLRDCFEVGEDINRLREERNWGVFVKRGEEGNKQLKMAREHALAEYSIRERLFKDRKEKKEVSDARQRFIARVTAPGYEMTNVDKILMKKYENERAEEKLPEKNETRTRARDESTEDNVDGINSINSVPQIDPSGYAPRGTKIETGGKNSQNGDTFAGKGPDSSTYVDEDTDDDTDEDQEEAKNGENPDEPPIMHDEGFAVPVNQTKRHRQNTSPTLRSTTAEQISSEAEAVTRRRLVTKDTILDELQAHKARRNRWLGELESQAPEERNWNALAKLDTNVLAQLRTEGEIAGVMREIKGNTIIAVSVGTSIAADRTAILSGDTQRLSSDARLALNGIGLSRKMQSIRELAGIHSGTAIETGNVPEISMSVNQNGEYEALEDELAASSGNKIHDSMGGQYLKVYRDEEKF